MSEVEARRDGPPRVVSLLPSATEMVCFLGAADALVGISHECDHPEEIRDRPVLTRSRLGPGGSSGEIDRAVRGLVSEALSIYEVDPDGLRAAAPDFVLTQDLCKVCAVSLEDVRSAVARLASREGVRVVSLSPTRLEDVLADVERVAEALGIPEDGTRARRGLEERIRAVADRASSAATRPRVVSVEWLDPLMLGGTWMPELIELAGGTAAGVEAGAPAPTVTPEELAALEPDVVLVKPCGFDVRRTLDEAGLLRTAVVDLVGEDTDVFVSDGNAFFNRPGPRLVESLEILAACTHPQMFGDLAAKHRNSIVQLPSGHPSSFTSL